MQSFCSQLITNKEQITTKQNKVNMNRRKWIWNQILELNKKRMIQSLIMISHDQTQPKKKKNHNQTNVKV